MKEEELNNVVFFDSEDAARFLALWKKDEDKDGNKIPSIAKINHLRTQNINGFRCLGIKRGKSYIYTKHELAQWQLAQWNKKKA